MRTLIGIALALIAATSADAALQITSATVEKPAVVAASQRIAFDLADAHIPGNAMQAPASCQFLPKTDALEACGIEDASLLASAPPRRPPRRTRRR
jgi:hypothetical protein